MFARALFVLEKRTYVRYYKERRKRTLVLVRLGGWTMRKIIFLIDMQSFYASVEKAANPAYRDQPLVVSGDPARRAGIVLAACPIAKKFGVSTTQRLGEAMRKCPDLVVLRPRMKMYLDVSVQISSILYRYTDLVEPYSIDEQFCDMTGVMHFHQMNAEQLAGDMQRRIWEEVGVYARVGISENKILAKMACDNFAKKVKGGIFILPRDQMATYLWPLSIGCLFGVGARMEKHLQRIGILTIGDLAQTSLDRLRAKWGVNGVVLWQTANGIDDSPVTVSTHDQQKAIGHQMTLPRDYVRREELEVVLLELSEEVGRRARRKGYRGTVFSLGCVGGAYTEPIGFHHQMTFSQATNATDHLYHAARQLFRKHWDGFAVRRLGVALSGLQATDYVQLDLFEDRSRYEALEEVVDALRDQYGSAIIRRASSFLPYGQAFERANKIGGHYK